MAAETYHRYRKLKILIIAVGLGILGVLVAVYIGYRQLLNAPEQLIATIAEDAKLSLGKIQQTATRDGKTEWRLEAASARYLESQDQVQLDNLTVTFFLDSGQEVQLSATEGVLNTKSNDIQVKGNVRVKNEDYSLTTAALHYRHEERVIFSNAPVVIERSVGGRLSGDVLKLNLKTNLMVLEGNVRGIFDEPQPS